MLKVNGDERTTDDAVRALHQLPSFVDTLMLTDLENQATKDNFKINSDFKPFEVRQMPRRNLLLSKAIVIGFFLFQ